MKKAFVSVLFFILILSLVTGCAKSERLDVEIYLPDQGTAAENEAAENETIPTETAVSVFDVYLDILTENIDILTSTQTSKDIGDGKIAVLDVFGNDAPELAFIYNRDEISEFMKIFTYSEPEGATLVFDSEVYAAAGGGGNYCVFLTRDNELMVYRSTYNAQFSCGFWPIIPNQNLETVPDYGVYTYSSDLAKLYFFKDYSEEEEFYLQDREEISQGQFEESAKEIMANIDRVIFQSSDMEEYGLYERDRLWKNLTPFKADCMTLKEAFDWLRSQG